MVQQELKNRKQAAEFLGVHPTTLDRWVADGTIQAIKIPGKKYTRFTLSSLKALTTVTTQKQEA